MSKPLDDSPTLVMDTLTGELVELAHNPSLSVSENEEDDNQLAVVIKGALTLFVWLVYIGLASQPGSPIEPFLVIAPMAVTGLCWGVVVVGIVTAVLVPAQVALYLIQSNDNSVLDYLLSSPFTATIMAALVGLLVGWLTDTQRLAHQSLAQSEQAIERYARDLVPLLSMGEELTILVNQRGVVVAHSRPSDGLFANLSNQAVGRPLSELLWPGVANTVLERVASAHQERRPCSIEQTLTVDDENIVLLISATVHGAHRTLVSIRDITEYRQKETSLRDTKERYALAIEGAQDGMWDWDLPTGDVYWSHRWRTLFHVDKLTVRGRLSDWLKRVHHQDIKRVETEIHDQLASDASHFLSEHRIIVADGHENRWMLARGVIIRDKRGTVIRVAGSFTDITDRRTTALTQEKSALLEHATHAIGVGIAIVSPDNTLTNVSPTLTKMQSDWPNPNAWWADVRDKITAPIAATCQRCGEQETLGTATTEVLSPTGRMHVFEIVFSGHGHEVTTDQPANVLLIRDITRRMVAEEHLRRLNAQLVSTRDEALAASRAKSTFLANMSHELRTPLNAILGYTEMLIEEIDEVEPGSQAVKDLEKVHGAGAHLLQLIGGVLDLSKIEAGRMEFTTEKFHIRDLVDDVLATIQPLIEKGGNTLLLSIDEDIGAMRADMTKLRQVLLNLLSNAGKFTTDGDITLAVQSVATPSGTFIHFLISDTGIGITETAQARLFEEFFQADASSTRKHDGTGLGLAISRRFCLMMGGDITLESQSGVGTTFTVSLPIDADPNQLSEPELPAVGLTPRRSALLTLDAHAGFCTAIRNGYSDEGFSLLVGTTVSEGITLAFQHRPALIIADPLLPSNNDFCIIEQIRAVDNLTLVPLLALFSVDRDAACQTKPDDTSTAGDILIFDREPTSLKPLSAWLTAAGWSVIATSQASEASRALNDESIGLCIANIDPRAPEDVSFLTDQRYPPPMVLHLKPGALTTAFKSDLARLKKLPTGVTTPHIVAQLTDIMRYYLDRR